MFEYELGTRVLGTQTTCEFQIHIIIIKTELSLEQMSPLGRPCIMGLLENNHHTECLPGCMLDEHSS